MVGVELLVMAAMASDTFDERWFFAKPLPPQITRPIMAKEMKHLRQYKPDICQRHGLKKTWVSRWRWRCRH